MSLRLILVLHNVVDAEDTYTAKRADYGAWVPEGQYGEPTVFDRADTYFKHR